MTGKSAYHQFTQVQPPSSRLIPHSQIQFRVQSALILGLPSDKFGAGYSNLPGLSDEGRTPRSGHATLDDSFVRHDAYFFKDGNVTFLVRGPPAFVYPMCRHECRLMVRYTVSIDTSFPAILSISLHDFPGSISVTTKLCPL